MNILFSITYYHPYVSGLTIYVKRLAEALVSRGHSATILCMQHDPTLSETENIHGVTVIRVKPLLTVSKGFLSFHWIPETWKTVRNADVVVINLPQMEGWWVALAAKLMSKPVIAVYHCEVDLSKGFMNDIIQSFLEIANTITLLLSDTVITYTKDYANASRILHPFMKKITYVNPPIPIPVVDKKIQERLKKKIGQSDVVIGVAARLSAEKGIEYLLEAISSLIPHTSNLKLVVAGELDPVGEGTYKRKILHLVKKLKHSVVFLGNLKQEEMGAFYSLLDCLILPSINSTEAFGMVQVEAMLCGVPVVASNLPGVRIPIKKTGMGIIVPPKDSKALAEAIKTIVKNRQSFIRPQQEIAKLFSFEKTIDFYEKLALKGVAFQG